MNTELLGIILSGQLLLVLWQIYKEIADRKQRRKQEALASQKNDEALRSMVFKLYRDSMERKIVDTYGKIEENSPDLREYLMSLQDDMEFYITQGGNGLVKELYTHLENHVRQTKGEAYYLLLVIE